MDFTVADGYNQINYNKNYYKYYEIQTRKTSKIKSHFYKQFCNKYLLLVVGPDADIT